MRDEFEQQFYLLIRRISIRTKCNHSFYSSHKREGTLFCWLFVSPHRNNLSSFAFGDDEFYSFFDKPHSHNVNEQLDLTKNGSLSDTTATQQQHVFHSSGRLWVSMEKNVELKNCIQFYAYSSRKSRRWKKGENFLRI